MPAIETFRDIPEIFETVLEESIKVRNETLNTFKQLGPADLVHVVKTIPNTRQQIKEVSSYHFALGIDTSSSASIAAYINSLTYSMKQPNRWFGGLTLKNSWSLSRSTYCTFNAFSGVDVRVEARIPGGVKSYTIDAMGIKRPTTAECWQEVYLSSILRTIFQDSDSDEDFNDDTSLIHERSTKRNLNGLLLNLQLEMKFLELANKLFSKGWQLGTPTSTSSSHAITTLAGLHNNFLTVGLVKYFCGTGRPEIVIGFLKPYVEKDANLAGIVIKCYLESNQQGLAIKTIANTLKNNNHTNSGVSGQISDFLVQRDQLEKGKHFGEEALRLGSSEFSNWSRLISIEIELNNFERALIILNNAPMSFESLSSTSASSEFMKKLPKPAAISIPFNENRDHSSSAEINNNTSETNSNNNDGSTGGVLEKLKGNYLRGNYREAYELIVKMYKKIGWDALLAIRSKIFVMEDEYREKEIEEVTTTDVSELGNNSNVEFEFDDKSTSTASTIGDATNSTNITSGNSTSSTRNNSNSTKFLHKTDKKLCEKWLDNLFLILFQDLRIFSFFSQEREIVNSVKKRSGKEWLLLGKLSERLKQHEDAKFAYQKCLFSSTGTINNLQNHRIIQSTLHQLIQIYCEEGRVPLAITMTMRLINNNSSNKDQEEQEEGDSSGNRNRNNNNNNSGHVMDMEDYIPHCDGSNFDFYSSKITYSLFSLIKRFGLHRIRGDLQAGGLADGPTGQTFQQFLHFAQEAKVHGFDY